MEQSSRFEETVRTMLIFGVIGPPIGGAAAALVAAGTAGLGAIPVAMAVSYIFGLVPALLTGMVAGLVNHKLGRGVFTTLVVVCGAFFSLLFTVLTGDLEGSPMSVQAETLELTAIPGAISGLALALLIWRKA